MGKGALMTGRLLRADKLWKNYGTHAVVKGISFSLCGGEIVGLVGPNGAGKTTTVSMLYGAVVPDKGQSLLGPWNMQREGHEARRRLGIVTQEDNLDPDLTAAENLRFFMHHYRIGRKKAAQKTATLLARVGLEAFADYAVDELSGGLKRRLVLARALVNDPEFLFLDEPTTGLDPEARQAFWKLIAELRLDGRGILLTTHYMEESERLCDRLLLLKDGSVVDQGKPAELIARVAGERVIEIEGIAEDRIRHFLPHPLPWIRPLGAGFAFDASSNEVSMHARELEEQKPRRFVRRQANLDDVFFLLTGDKLE